MTFDGCSYMAQSSCELLPNSISLQNLLVSTTIAERQSSSSADSDYSNSMPKDLELLKIKVVASSITHKLQALEQIKESWDTDDVDFSKSRLEIGLQIEYSLHASEEVVTMSEQLLSNPPSYNDNPDEKRQKQLELTVLAALMHDYAENLEERVEELSGQVNDAMETRVEEALARARQVHAETHDVKVAAKKLRLEEEGVQ